VVSLDTFRHNADGHTFRQLLLHQTKRLSLALVIGLPLRSGFSLHIAIYACMLSASAVPQPRTHLHAGHLSPLADHLLPLRRFRQRHPPLILLRTKQPPLDRTVFEPVPGDDVELLAALVVVVPGRCSLNFSVIELNRCKHSWVLGLPVLLGTQEVSGGVAEAGDLSAAVAFDPLSNFGGSVTEVSEDEDGARRKGRHGGCLRNGNCRGAGDLGCRSWGAVGRREMSL